MGRMVLGQYTVSLADLEAQARSMDPESSIDIPGMGTPGVKDVLFLGGVRQWIEAHAQSGAGYDPAALQWYLGTSRVAEGPPMAPGAPAPPSPSNGLVPGIPTEYLIGGALVVGILLLKGRR